MYTHNCIYIYNYIYIYIWEEQKTAANPTAPAKEKPFDSSRFVIMISSVHLLIIDCGSEPGYGVYWGRHVVPWWMWVVAINSQSILWFRLVLGFFHRFFRRLMAWRVRTKSSKMMLVNMMHCCLRWTSNEMKCVSITCSCALKVHLRFHGTARHCMSSRWKNEHDHSHWYCIWFEV